MGHAGNISTSSYCVYTLIFEINENQKAFQYRALSDREDAYGWNSGYR